MPSYLLDTNFCVHFLRGRAWARSALARISPREAMLSAVTVGELHEGIHRSSDPGRERARVEAFLQPFQVLAFGREEAVLWGELEAGLRKSGKPLEAEDSMIAASALRHGLTLVTGNLKPFDRIHGLETVDWERTPPAGG